MYDKKIASYILFFFTLGDLIFNIFTRLADFIHGHVHASKVVVGDVIAEASRLILMTHVEAQVIWFCRCAQRDVHRAKVNANVKDDGVGACQALLVVGKCDVGQRRLW